jgi:glycerol-3-phosphate dehydrogenase
MGKELGWTSAKKKEELKDAKVFLQCMGSEARSELKNIPINFSPVEIQGYTRTFSRFDYNKDGHITVLEMRKALDEMGESVSEEQLHDLIAEVDLNKNSTIELDEFLQLMSCLKTGAIANSRLATIVKNYEQQIPVDRSGGGV